MGLITVVSLSTSRPAEPMRESGYRDPEREKAVWARSPDKSREL